MERLTIRTTSGEVGLRGYTPDWAALAKLANYEDTGLEPGEVERLSELALAGQEDRVLVMPRAVSEEERSIIMEFLRLAGKLQHDMKDSSR